MKMKQLVITAIGALMVAGTAFAQAPFGGADDVAYSKALWQSLNKANLVGRGAHMSTPYIGQHPHGAILDMIDGFIRVQGDSGVVMVKRNYGGDGVSKTAVADDPGKFLESITVMFKRSGYDSETRDWFWVKYNPDGSLAKNPAGMMLAGKVAKGKPKGCIACHMLAPGGDLVYNSNSDRYQ